MSLTYGFTMGGWTDSKAFSDALHAVVGDGITLYGGRFNLTVNGFAATLSSGYAFAAGRWVENDEPLRLTISPPNRNDDRTDALAVRVDYGARTAALEVLVGVTPETIQEELSSVRNDEQYCVLLYFIKVRRGVTSLTPDDVTDLRGNNALCGKVVPLSDIAGKVIYIYQFLVSGIDQEVARLIGLSESIVKRADEAITEMDKAIQQAGGAPGVGELMTARHHPAPLDEWLLCDGSAVPEKYPTLNALMGGTLPDISTALDRYGTYIYSGTPVR